jgi:CrtC N-terminal lipocalin domain
MTVSDTPLAVTASAEEDYRRLGLDRGTVRPWEDGARTDNRRGTYEWWYFDAHLQDGSTLVVVFLNKDINSPNKPLEPTIRLNLDLADGRSFEKVVSFPASAWSAATEHADVQIAANRFTGDLHSYRITATAEEISVDVTLTGDVPSWRPETGFMLFGPGRDKEFAWLPSVPQGTVEATYRIGDETHHSPGAGYHDHNWGNAPLMQLVHDWYWARGQAGPYSVIASMITSHEKYGYTPLPILMLAKDGKIIADDSRAVRFETGGVYTDELTGKPVASVTRYIYDAGGQRYVVTFTRRQDLTRDQMIEGVHGPKRVLARLARFDGAYLRFTGDVRVERWDGDSMTEQFEDKAIWELMYFGHARP